MSYILGQVHCYLYKVEEYVLNSTLQHTRFNSKLNPQPFFKRSPCAEAMADRRVLFTGSAPTNAPQYFPNTSPEYFPNISAEYFPNTSPKYFPNTSPGYFPNTSLEYYQNTAPQYIQNPLPNSGWGFYNPECHNSEPVEMAAQINGGFPHYSLPEHIQQPHPSLNTGLNIVSSAPGPPTDWIYGYKASPAPGQYNIGPSSNNGHFIPTYMTSGELASFPVISGHDNTSSLNKQAKFVPGSNSPKISPSLKSGPAFPNNPPHFVEQPRTVKKDARTRGLNKRGQNIQNLDPSGFYDSLPGPPPSWISEEKEDEDRFMFEYNEYGELKARIRLSKRQMKAFLYQHPLHKKKRGLEPRKGALTLWIQTVPDDSNARYRNQRSDKCRFAECPVRNNTIHKGFYRVAIDEHHNSGIRVNPYHCAGFVHLYCLEKFLDFQDLCKHVNVQPDNRLLDEPKNKMALTREHDELFKVAKDFIANSEHTPGWNFKRTLSHQLTEKNLILERRSRARKRLNMGGNHLGRHRGDLEVFVKGERLKMVEGRKRTREGEHKGGERGELRTKNRRTGPTGRAMGDGLHTIRSACGPGDGQVGLAQPLRSSSCL
jgi:hypothetical protein